MTGAVVGGIQAYVGYQVADNYRFTDNVGSILWQNVVTAAMINAATGCAAASATGGNCGQAALSGAMGTVGSAFGLTGSLIAGCAAGKIGGGSCSEGAMNALGTYAVYSAVGYVVDSQQKGAAASSDGALNVSDAAFQAALDQQGPLLAVNTLSPGCPAMMCSDLGGPGGGGGGGGGARAPVGRSGNPLGVSPGTNSPSLVGGVNYSGHALDQMQGRGIPPSAVQNAINTGTTFPTRAGTTGHYDSINNIRVITNSRTGGVVTVIPGSP